MCAEPCKLGLGGSLHLNEKVSKRLDLLGRVSRPILVRVAKLDQDFMHARASCHETAKLLFGQSVEGHVAEDSLVCQTMSFVFFTVST